MLFAWVGVDQLPEPEAGLKMVMSAMALLPLLPPVMSTLPSVRTVAVCPSRVPSVFAGFGGFGAFGRAVRDVQVLFDGLKVNTVFRLAEPELPPTMSTLLRSVLLTPVASSVAGVELSSRVWASSRSPPQSFPSCPRGCRSWRC